MTSLFSSVQIKNNPRAKSVRLRLDPRTGQVILTKPPRVSQSYALAFLEQHRGWIARQQARLENSAVELVPMASLSLFGETIQLIHNPQHIGRPHLVNGQLIVGGRVAFFTRRVLDFVRDESVTHLRRAVDGFATQLGVRVQSLAVRDTQSRWGSCSAAGALHFSWRLAFAPSSVLRYVAAHEVAHLVEHNHSPRFWAIVNQLVGDFREEEAWLAHHGAGLLQIGAKKVV